ncbi:hypothetical protein V1525DRAFT_348389 [Lipomyces kononenkoae]|uniref:Uncharacterized protein n=1 Tax=Lipomyces kononenkoae TaxID=34357 RepID=A0ACC3SUW4_LIPKO
MEIQESKTVSDALRTKVATLEAEVSSLKDEIDTKSKDIEVKERDLEELKSAARAVPGRIEDGTVTAGPVTQPAGEEQQKRLEELQAILEKTQVELTEATKVNEARAAEAAEAAKLKEELDKRQTELEEIKKAASAAAAAPIESTSQELEKKLADLRTDLETKHKTELEEALKAKIAEMEAQKTEAVNKAREVSQKESAMRNKLLQHLADKAEKDKIEAQRQLALLRGEIVAPSTVSSPLPRTPLASQTPTTVQGSPSGPPSDTSHQATTINSAQPLTPDLQVQNASQSPQSAPPSGPRQLQPPQAPSLSQQSQASQQPATSIPVRSMTKAVIGLQPQPRSQSQLPQRPGLQPLRGHGSQAAGGTAAPPISNPLQAQMLQHLQPGPRRNAPQLVRSGAGPQVQGPAGAATLTRPSHIPHPPSAGGGIKIAGTATSIPRPEASPESNAGVKRSREDEAAGPTGGDTSGTTGDSQTTIGEPATGPPVALKRRREETQ